MAQRSLYYLNIKFKQKGYVTILEPGESTRFLGVKIGFSHPNPPFFSLREPSRALARLRRRSIPVVASVHTLLFLIWGLSDTLYHFFSPKVVLP